MKMKTKPSASSRRGAAADQGLTLIEMIGVLAVIGILAGVVLTALTKQTDKVVADQESALLKAFGDGFQRAVLRRSLIPGPFPGPTNWASTIATEIAFDVSEVTTNSRHQQRHFIFANAGANNPPYRQDYTGLPANLPLRFMILSSLGAGFPIALQDGPINPTDFSNTWNTADGTVPSMLLSLGWPGTGDDLKVQRIDLSGVVVHLLLSYAASTSPAYYSINGVQTPNPLPNGTSDLYFLQNSVLGLYASNSVNLDSQQILVRDTSFVYYEDAWRATAAETPIPIQPYFIGTLDPAAVAAAFLATNSLALPVFESFTNYMNAYNAWAAQNFSTSDPTYSNVLGAYNMVSNSLAY
jgi:prepilin-type N-terminal cleavage/methylation domain-containing protein